MVKNLVSSSDQCEHSFHSRKDPNVSPGYLRVVDNINVFFKSNMGIFEGFLRDYLPNSIKKWKNWQLWPQLSPWKLNLQTKVTCHEKGQTMIFSKHPQLLSLGLSTKYASKFELLSFVLKYSNVISLKTYNKYG